MIHIKTEKSGIDGKPRIKIIGPNMGLFMIIGVILSILKLCGVIGWSWWVVLMPVYLPLGLFICVAAVVASVWTVVYGILIPNLEDDCVKKISAKLARIKRKKEKQWTR